MFLLALLATTAVTEIRLFQTISDTLPLSVSQWIICPPLGTVIIWVMEVVKLINGARM
jgi:hypothetical protein